MHPPGSRSPARLLVGTVTAVLTGVLFAPGVARGSCGDYVMMGPESGTHQSPHSPAGPKPCDGPNCSQGRQPLAPPAPARAPTSSGDDWACPTVPPSLADPGSAFLAAPEAGRRPLRRGTDVYHPPR